MSPYQEGSIRSLPKGEKRHTASEVAGDITRRPTRKLLAGTWGKARIFADLPSSNRLYHSSHAKISNSILLKHVPQVPPV